MVYNFVYHNLEIKSADEVQQLRAHLPKANKIKLNTVLNIGNRHVRLFSKKNQSNEAIIRLHQNPARSVAKLSRTM